MQSNATVAELQARLIEHQKTKEMLDSAKGRLLAACNRLKALEWEHEVAITATCAKHVYY